MSPMNNRLLRPTSNYDADALRYINAVQVADGQALEPEVRTAIDAFVRGCKSDGIWDAIKASCIMAGARTISGALVPLAGDAPTPYNFTGNDYNRTTGIKGDGSTTYLDSNRANNADAQDNKHLSVFASAASSAFSVYAGSQFQTVIYRSGSVDLNMRVNRGAPFTLVPGAANATGFLGANRPAFGIQEARADGTTVAESLDATTHLSENTGIFARLQSGSPFDYIDGRLSFYSIGSALDLAALDARVSTLISSIATALS